MTGAEIFLTQLFYALPALLIAFVLHELAHAWIATRCGDPTPRAQGRLTLDPRQHIDPIGFTLLLLVGFGWAKPVQFSPAYVRNPQQQAAVAGAGPLTNLILAVVFALLLHVDLALTAGQTDYSLRISDAGINGIIFFMLGEGLFLNVILFVFNSLPVPGLDGFWVARGLLGRAFPELFTWMDINRQAIYVSLFFVVFLLPSFTQNLGLNPVSGLTALIVGVNDFLYHSFVDPNGSTVIIGLPSLLRDLLL